MAWGLEARVPFLDKAFLEVAMNVDPKQKMFSKGAAQEVDADGRPKMEKVISPSCEYSLSLGLKTDVGHHFPSIFCARRSIIRRMGGSVELPHPLRPTYEIKYP
jgi:hypothetical protein